MDANDDGVVSIQEVCYHYLPGALWICDNYPTGDDDGNDSDDDDSDDDGSDDDGSDDDGSDDDGSDDDGSDDDGSDDDDSDDDDSDDDDSDDEPNFEELWEILTSVTDGKVTLSDYKAVSHLIWPDASDIHVELAFQMHDLDDNGIVEEHEAKKVIVHTPILQDLIGLASDMWEILDVNDNGAMDFDELINIYQVAYTLDFTEEELNMEEARNGFNMLKAVLGGELTQERILRAMRDAIREQSAKAMATQR